MNTTNNLIKSEGYCFLNNLLLVGDTIADAFRDSTGFESFCARNSAANGIYSLYFLNNDEAFLYVSPGGFQKLFYAVTDGKIKVSAFAGSLFNGTLNDDAMTEFRSTLHCWGENTFYKDVYAVEPGCAVRINGEGVERRKLFSYAASYVEISTRSYPDLMLQGNEVFDRVATRMIAFLNGRQAVIPLSGGYDSRFILAALVSKGYSNIVAVTYGTEAIPDRVNAQQSANVLGVPWYFISYTPAMLYKWREQFNFKSYFDFMVNGNSFACLHEIMALCELKDQKLIASDAVFIPGHSGDFLGGSQYVKVFPPDLTRGQISSHLIKKKFDTSFYRPKALSLKLRELQERVNSYPADAIPSTVFEDIDAAGKLSKHILNAAKAYEFFGYECYFPFWDKELVEFFRTVPSTLKLGKKLYDDILRSYYFDPLNISFGEELHPSLSQLKLQHVKNIVREYFPGKLKEYYARKNDFFLYRVLTDSWREQMLRDGFISKHHHYSYNSLIAQWILYRLKRQMSSSE